MRTSNVDAPSSEVAQASLRAVSSEAYFCDALADLAAKPGQAELEVLMDTLARYYGLRGTTKVLSSEAEHTAEVGLSDGRQLIFKTSSQKFARESFRFQAEAIAALKSAHGFVVPEILRTNSGALLFEDPDSSGYLQTWVTGVPLQEARVTPDLLYQVGRALASLDDTFRPFHLSGMHRPILWHIGCCRRLMRLGEHLPSGLVAGAVHLAMEHYVTFVEPQLGNVVWQVVHNDPSPFNTLVTKKGIAFIDFGDGCWGPRIQDLAIAASHFVLDPTSALGGAESLIAGYDSVTPLSPNEISVLVGLMRARQSALILINYWRSHLFPSNAAYIKKNVARTERGLMILTSLGAEEATAAVANAIAARQPTASP